MVWVKRVGILLVALIALLVAAIIYVVAFVDPNQFKGELQKVAKEQANVTLRMDGDISWSFYPRIGLSLENIGVALGDEPEIVSFSKAEFGVALLPLFQQRIEVNTVRLENLTADLKVDKNGNANWQLANADSTAAQTASASSGSSSQKNSVSDGSFTMPDIALDELAVVNAHINYEDARADLKANVVSNVSFTDVRLNESWPMRMTADITQSALDGENPLQAKLDFGANFTLFAERQSVSFEKLVLNATLEGESLPKSPLTSRLSVAQFDFDLPQENAVIDGFNLESLGINVSGQMKAYQVMSAPEFSAVIDVDEFSPKNVLTQLNIKLPDMADEQALESASASISVRGSLDSIKAQPISVKFDETTLEANALVNLSPLNWDVAVAGANLDADRYLPPPSDEPTTEPANDTGANDPAVAEELFPVDLIRSLNGHVGFAFDNLKVKNLQLDRIELDSTQTNGKVLIAPAQVTLYDGDAALQAELDVTGTTPEISVSPKVDHVQILPLLTDFMDLKKIQGATNLTGDLTTRGNKVDDLMANLNGDLLVNISDGALLGTNFTKMVCEGIAFVGSSSLNDDAFGKNTPFETMRFPAKIVNGEISTPGLTMASLTLGVTGDGSISLPNSSLDYEARVAVIGSSLDKSCAVKDSIANLEFPIVCKGKFTDDAAGLCRPDFKGFAATFTNQAKAKAQAKLDAEKAKAKAKLEEEKAQAKAKLEAEKAEAAAKLEEEKARLKEKEDQAKDKLEDKLKSKLKDLF